MRAPVLGVVLMSCGALATGCGSSATTTTKAASRIPSTQSASTLPASSSTTTGQSSTPPQRDTHTQTSSNSTTAPAVAVAPGSPLDLRNLCNDLTAADADSFARGETITSRHALAGGYACNYNNLHAHGDPTVGLAVYAPGHGLANGGQAQALFNSLSAAAKRNRGFIPGSHFIDHPLGGNSILTGGSVGSGQSDVGIMLVQNGTIIDLSANNVPGNPKAVGAHIMSLLHSY